VEQLTARGDEVTVLSRNAEAARSRLGIPAIGWDPLHEPAPADALGGRDAVVHLAGENLAQRWSDESRARIRASRETGTANLVAGLRTADPRPRVLVSSSAVGYYGPHGDEQLDETAPAGDDFAARVCAAWERSALAAEALGVRVVLVRTGVVLDAAGGALAKMLPPFRLGAGGPVAGGRQYLSWVHRDDLVGLYLAALDGEAWRGPINATAPAPVTNAAFSKALGRALRRPAIAPVPRLALKLLYGDMEQLVTTGQRAVPKRALELGYAYRHADLDEALRDALG
jgi:uncharacterized protein (TIGR01777 family)